MIDIGNKCAIKNTLIIIFTIQLSIELSSLNLNSVHCQSASTNLSSNSPESNSSDDDFNDEAIGPEVNFTLTSKDKIGEF